MSLKVSGASASWARTMVGSCPALTKARCSQFGYWSTYKGGYLDLGDMARLQGFASNQVSICQTMLPN